MSELLSHRLDSQAEAVVFGKKCWEAAMVALAGSHGLGNMLQMAQREPRIENHNYCHEEYQGLFGDLNYIARTLA